MKHLFIVLLTALLSLPTMAGDFELDFLRNKDGTQTIIHNTEDWLLVSDTAGFDLLIDKSLTKEKKTIYLLHSVTILKPPKTFAGIEGITARIYTNGVLMCDNAIVSLSGEFYTDKNGVIIFYNAFEPGTYLVEVLTKNTARNDVYNLLCKDSE
jgi:hypothetical protein